MLANSLKLINEAEAQAEQILIEAQQTVQTIEKETYQQIEQLRAENEQEIAREIAKLPRPAVGAPAAVVLNVSDKQMKAAVDLITKSLLTEFVK